MSSDCSASSCLGTTPPPVPPFLRNARGGKTREALSRRGFYGDQALKLLRRSPKSTSSRVFSRSKHSAPARLGEGGDAPANAGTHQRKGVYELRRAISLQEALTLPLSAEGSCVAGPEKISVIIPTYNRADYLRLSLGCLALQDYRGPVEIVVADDGSSDHTPQVIEEARRNGLPVMHRWCEDKGYRRAFIVNEGVRASSGDLLVILDCDCMARPDLLSTYARAFAPGCFYLGGIWKLNEACAEEALPKGDARFLLQLASKPEFQLAGQRRRFWKRYLKSLFAAHLPLAKPKIWGGNFAVNRVVFEAVNGFDENFVGWGREDSDLRNRLVRGGYRCKPLHRRALAYHLWHPKDWSLHVGPDGERANLAYYRRRNVPVVCRKGLRQEGPSHRDSA